MKIMAWGRGRDCCLKLFEGLTRVRGSSPPWSDGRSRACRQKWQEAGFSSLGKRRPVSAAAQRWGARPKSGCASCHRGDQHSGTTILRGRAGGPGRDCSP